MNKKSAIFNKSMLKKNNLHLWFFQSNSEETLIGMKRAWEYKTQQQRCNYNSPELYKVCFNFANC